MKRCCRLGPLIGGILGGLAACGGYADLPIQERLFAPAIFEVFPGAVPPLRDGPTRLQVRLDRPANIDPETFPEPWVIVGHPTIQSNGGRVIAWARGACDEGDNARQPASGLPLRLCTAVRWADADTAPEAAFLTVVVESRATGQRVTFIADALASTTELP